MICNSAGGCARTPARTKSRARIAEISGLSDPPWKTATNLEEVLIVFLSETAPSLLESNGRRLTDSDSTARCIEPLQSRCFRLGHLQLPSRYKSGRFRFPRAQHAIAPCAAPGLIR